MLVAIIEAWLPYGVDKITLGSFVAPARPLRLYENVSAGCTFFSRAWMEAAKLVDTEGRRVNRVETGCTCRRRSSKPPSLANQTAGPQQDCAKSRLLHHAPHQSYCDDGKSSVRSVAVLPRHSLVPNFQTERHAYVRLLTNNHRQHH